MKKIFCILLALAATNSYGAAIYTIAPPPSPVLERCNKNKFSSTEEYECLKSAIEANYYRFNRAYKRQLRKNPLLTGSLTFTIRRNMTAEIEVSSFKNPKFEHGLIKMVNRTPFGNLTELSAEHSFTLVFPKKRL